MVIVGKTRQQRQDLVEYPKTEKAHFSSKETVPSNGGGEINESVERDSPGRGEVGYQRQSIRMGTGNRDGGDQQAPSRGKRVKIRRTGKQEGANFTPDRPGNNKQEAREWEKEGTGGELRIKGWERRNCSETWRDD